MEEDGVERQIMFLPLIVVIHGRLQVGLPNTHERMNGDVLVRIQEEAGQQVDEVSQEDETKNEDEDYFGYEHGKAKAAFDRKPNDNTFLDGQGHG